MDKDGERASLSQSELWELAAGVLAYDDKFDETTLETLEECLSHELEVLRAARLNAMAKGVTSSPKKARADSLALYGFGSDYNGGALPPPPPPAVSPSRVGMSVEVEASLVALRKAQQLDVVLVATAADWLPHINSTMLEALERRVLLGFPDASLHYSVITLVSGSEGASPLVAKRLCSVSSERPIAADSVTRHLSKHSSSTFVSEGEATAAALDLAFQTNWQSPVKAIVHLMAASATGERSDRGQGGRASEVFFFEVEWSGSQTNVAEVLGDDLCSCLSKTISTSGALHGVMKKEEVEVALSSTSILAKQLEVVRDCDVKCFQLSGKKMTEVILSGAGIVPESH